jgi:hypothetical protein
MEIGGTDLVRRTRVLRFLLLIGVLSLLRTGTGLDGSILQRDRPKGSLDIRVHPKEGTLTPPVDLLLVDPLGRTSGRDPQANQLLSEIPYSSYEAESLADDVSGAPGPETRILYLSNPVEGEYLLKVVGTETGEYTLEIRGHDEGLNPSHVIFQKVTTAKNTEHRYQIDYSPVEGSQITVVSLTPAGD